MTQLEADIARIIREVKDPEFAARLITQIVPRAIGKTGGRPRKTPYEVVTNPLVTPSAPVPSPSPLNNPPLCTNPDPEDPECRETEAADLIPTRPVEPPEDSLLEFACDGKARTWHLTASFVAECQENFPSLDVMAQFGRARLWVEANPEKRKTARGMPTFLLRWLDRAQNGNGARASPQLGLRPVDVRVGHVRVEPGKVYPDGEQEL